MSTAVGYCHKVQACHWRRHFPDLTNNKSFKHLLKNLRNSSTSATYRLSHKTSIVPSYKASSWINHQNQITVCTVHFVFAQCQHYWILQRAWCVVFVISMTEFYTVSSVCPFSVGLNSVSTESVLCLLSAWLNSTLCAVFACSQWDLILFLQSVVCLCYQHDWILHCVLCLPIFSMTEFCFYRECVVYVCYQHDWILHCMLCLPIVSMTEFCFYREWVVFVCYQHHCVCSLSAWLKSTECVVCSFTSMTEFYTVCCECSLSAWLKSATCVVCSVSAG